MRSLILAIQFLTRLPTPQLKTFDPAWLADSARWFAPVGLLVGGVVAAGWLAGSLVDAWLAALLALVLWVWVTGGLHLDGLADLADALGAAHRDRNRFLAVLKDPHVGSFGVLALGLALLSKLVLLHGLAQQPSANVAVLILVPAWARLGAVAWSACLPPLAPGSGERFAWRTHWPTFWAAVVGLAAASAWAAPVLLAAPLVLAGWGLYLYRRLGGITGDCLGAGIEVSETFLLLLALLGPRLAVILA